MPNQTIKIIGINPSNNKLILDHERLEVDSKWIFRKITWKIKHDAVKSILIKPVTPKNVFETAIPTTFEKEVSLVVNRNEPKIDWEYHICWKDEKDKDHTSDPVIAIKPSRMEKFFNLRFLVTMLVSILAAMGLSIFIISKKNKTK